MATAIPRYRTRLGVSEEQRPLTIAWPKLQVKRTLIVSLLLGLCTFAAALLYVEQHVQVRTLNYDIIALKQRKKELIEHQKTLQLQFDQLKRLDAIEADMLKQGFVPVDDEQIRIVAPDEQSEPTLTQE